jgi:hydroxymethylglutaryl-CoA synthase
MKQKKSSEFEKNKKIGIVSMEHFSPRNCINQSELESFMGVSKGKFTIGLGQQRMRFCSKMEDVNSMAMTVTNRIMMRNKALLWKLGRLEYATETLLDKSKSTKTILIDVLKELAENKSIEIFDQLEGVTNINACFGGTAAIINCVNWVREQLSLG